MSIKLGSFFNFRENLIIQYIEVLKNTTLLDFAGLALGI
jgi:hypothetical protein